jgi:hypothetical protein
LFAGSKLAKASLTCLFMIASRYRINPGEAEHSYQTLVGILSPDGAIDLKKVRGYLALLGKERALPENLDAEKLMDFSMLPSPR